MNIMERTLQRMGVEVKPLKEGWAKYRVTLWSVYRRSGSQGWNIGQFYNEKDAQTAKAAMQALPQFHAADKIHGEFTVEQDSMGGYLSQKEYDAIRPITPVTVEEELKED